MSIRETFAANMKSWRKLRGFSQEELADRAGLDRTYISSLERQVYGVSIDVLARIADALGVEPEELLKRPTGAERPKA